MNLASYREFRPKTFDEVIGQNHITRTLANQVKNNNITHAYLFTGARGTGKTSCARIFSKAINCLDNQNGSPCGKCANCKALTEINTDILEIDAASNNKVDEIRDLRERIKYPPVVGNKKVYIIDEVHMLTESAFNALLKTLEEPPEYVVFILATTEVHKLPATILSRCTRFDFRLLSIEELVGQLKMVFNARKIKYDEESLYIIAKLGEGSSRDMLSIADTVIAYCEDDITITKTLEVLGLSSTNAVSNIVSAIGNSDIKSLFEGIKGALISGKNISVLCKELTEYFKNLLLVTQNISDFTILNIMPTDVDIYKNVSKLFTVAQLKYAFDKLSRIELDLKYSLNPQNLIEATCVSLMGYEPQKKELIKQVVVQKTEQEVHTPAQVSIPKEQSKENNRPIEILETDNKMVADQSNAGKIWGEVLVKVKEKNMFAFFASLKNVYGVESSNNILTIHTNDKAVFDIIDVNDKKEIILAILKELDHDYKMINVVYDENNKSKADIIKGLKTTFLDKLKVKK